MDEPIVEQWETGKRRSLKPPSDAESVRVNKQAATKTTKSAHKKITESDAISWWETASEVVDDMLGASAGIWLLSKEEAKRLGKPTATVYNEMPEKLRKVLGIENVKNGAFIVACLQLGWYMQKSVSIRLERIKDIKEGLANGTYDQNGELTDEGFRNNMEAMFAAHANGT